MPAFAAHYIFANELLPTLSRKFNREAVMLGTQGPDFLFYHRLLPHMRGKPSLTVGSKLHGADPAVLFGNMREFLTADSVAESYAAGFLMHYALDRNAHPYVYYVEEEYIKARHVHYWNFVVHNRIELNIDTYMLHDRMGYDDPRDFLPSDFICFDKEILMPAGELLAPVINKTFGMAMTAADIAQGYADMAYVHNLLRNKNGERSWLLGSLQFPLIPALGPLLTTATRMKQPDKYWDYMNLNKKEWHYLKAPEKRSWETFDEIFERAKKDAAELIDGFFGGADLSLLTQSLSFSTGVKV